MRDVPWFFSRPIAAFYPLERNLSQLAAKRHFYFLIISTSTGCTAAHQLLKCLIKVKLFFQPLVIIIVFVNHILEVLQIGDVLRLFINGGILHASVLKSRLHGSCIL